MLQGQVNQLDETGIIGSHDDGLIDQARQRSATLPQKGDAGHSAVPGCAGSSNQVRAWPAGAVQNQKVARASESLHLPCKNLVEPQVIPRRSKDGGVGGESDGRQGAAPLDVAYHVFRCEVLRIGSAPPVAAEEEGSTVSKNSHIPTGHLSHLAAEALSSQRHLSQTFQTLLDSVPAHRPPARTSLIRRIQLCRIRSGGTGVRGPSARIAPGFRVASSSTCSAPSCAWRKRAPVATVRSSSWLSPASISASPSATS